MGEGPPGVTFVLLAGLTAFKNGLLDPAEELLLFIKNGLLAPDVEAAPGMKGFDVGTEVTADTEVVYAY